MMAHLSILGLKLSWILFIIIPAWITAQHLQVESFSMDDGLVEPDARSFVQDGQGFIYFISGQSIMRHDGHSFLEIPNPPVGWKGATEIPQRLFSMSDSLILMVNQQGGFLFNTYQRKWNPVYYAQAIWDDPLFTRFLTSQSNEVIGVSTTGARDSFSFFVFSIDSMQRMPIFGDTKIAGDIHILQRDVYNRIFLIRGTEIYITNEAGKLEQTLEIDIPNYLYDPNSGLKGVFNKQGNVVFLYNSNFYLIQSDTIVVPHPINKHLRPAQHSFADFLLDDNENIWASGVNSNLIYYTNGNDILHDFHNSVSTTLSAKYASDIGRHQIFRDQSKTFWIGGDNGFMKAHYSNPLFKSYMTGKACGDAGQSDCIIRGLAEADDGSILISYYSNIARLRPLSQSIDHPFDLIQHLPFDLHNHNGVIYDNHGNYLDPLTGEKKYIEGGFEINMDLGVLEEDAEDNLYLASMAELKKLIHMSDTMYWKTIANLFNPSTIIEELHFDKKRNCLWISGNQELMVYDLNSHTLREQSLSEWELPATEISAIQNDREGYLWLATDHGLFLTNPEVGMVRAYSRKNGLCSNRIYGMIFEGDSIIWLSTSNGLSRFDVFEESFINFYREDGLPDNRFYRTSYLKGSDGTFYFGGAKGLVAFRPEEVMENISKRNIHANLVLTDVEITDERIDSTLLFNPLIDQPIHLHHWNKSLTIRFALTDYSRSGDLLYSYHLEGYEQSWTEPSKFNFARYSSLPPGAYLFQVKSRDAHGQWQQSQFDMKVEVHPGWWQTPWAFALYALLILVLIYSISQFLTRRWILKNQLKQKETLLREIHHRVKNNLQTISSLFSLQLANSDDERLIEAIEKSQERLQSMALIHHKLYIGSDFNQVAMKDFLHSLVSNINKSQQSEQQHIRINYDLDDIVLHIDTAIPLGLIANELLTNTFKHAFRKMSQGLIHVALKQKTDGAYWFCVADNGVGNSIKSDAHLADSGFGSQLIELLVQQLAGELNRKSENGLKTEITFFETVDDHAKS